MNITPVGNYSYKTNFGEREANLSRRDFLRGRLGGSTPAPEKRDCPDCDSMTGMKEQQSSSIRRAFMRGAMATIAMLAANGGLTGCVIKPPPGVLDPYLGMDPEQIDKAEAMWAEENRATLGKLESDAKYIPTTKFVPKAETGPAYKENNDVKNYHYALADVKFADEKVFNEQDWRKRIDPAPLLLETGVQYENDIANLKDALMLNYLRQGGKLEWLDIPKGASDADISRALLCNIKMQRHDQKKFTRNLALFMVEAINAKKECPETRKDINERYRVSIKNETMDPKFAIRAALNLMEREPSLYCEPPAWDLIQHDIQHNGGGSDGGGGSGSGSAGGGNGGGGGGGTAGGPGAGGGPGSSTGGNGGPSGGGGGASGGK